MKTVNKLYKQVGNKVKLVDRVAEEIESLIADGSLAPNTKLPPERDLADQMGVSRTVIREAVRILVARGLLQTRQGVGTTVQEVRRDNLTGSISFLLKYRGKEVSVEDLHELRRMFELEIARLAAQRRTKKEVTALSAIINEMESVQDSPEEFATKDAEFHQELAEMTHNSLHPVLLDSIADLMYHVRLLSVRHPKLPPMVLSDHREIVERVAAKDPEGAQRAMRQHLEHARAIQVEMARKGSGRPKRSDEPVANQSGAAADSQK